MVASAVLYFSLHTRIYTVEGQEGTREVGRFIQLLQA